MPKLDGLKTWRVPAPSGARKSVLEAIATAVAKATTQSRSLKYRSMATARPLMWADKRKSTRWIEPPANRGRRPFASGTRRASSKSCDAHRPWPGPPAAEHTMARSPGRHVPGPSAR